MRYATTAGPVTEFASGERLQLVSLHGLPSLKDAWESGTAGLASVLTSAGGSDALGLAARDAVFTPDRAFAKLAVGESGVVLATAWRFDAANAIWSRRDVLRNDASAPVTVRRCLARVALAPGRYALYAQDSRWGCENRGTWHDLPHGTLALGSHLGRTCVPATPYLFVRPRGGGPGLAFHVVPNGNWIIRAAVRGGSYDGLPVLVIEAGLADGELAYPLAPGAALELPEILIQSIPEGEPHAGAAALHRHVNAGLFARHKHTAPVVYNTWFDVYDRIEVPRLRRQLAVAREVGCEVFTMDAGWFGMGDGDWTTKVGDWRENTTHAFRGGMKAFADEVRGAGMAYGLWMEPERVAPESPLAREHPDWLLPGEGKHLRPDLEQPRVYDHILSEMSRLVTEYGLAWMKIDSNQHLGHDPRGRELHGYYAAWHRLLDELRARHSGTFFEGCASGGLRLELGLMAHQDAHFPSDNVNAYDMLRLLQGAALRVPLGRVTTWTVLKHFPDRGLVTPKVHGWNDAPAVDIEFAVAVCLPGILTLSGDLDSLPPPLRARLKERVDWWKARREFIMGASVRLLTPPAPLGDNTGWAAFHLERDDDPRSLLIAFRLDDPWPARWFRAAGRDILVELPARHRAAVVELTR